jgi:subtilisin family serine protease
LLAGRPYSNGRNPAAESPPAATPDGSAAHEVAARIVPGEFLVRFHSRTSRDSALGDLRKASLRPVQGFPSVPGLYLVADNSFREPAALKQALKLTADVDYVEPNFIYRAQAIPNDPDYATRLWALHNTGQTGGGSSPYSPDIQAEPAWDISTGASDLVVAVIDSGVDYNHEDLQANMFRNAAECDSDGIDDDGNGYVDDCRGIDVVENDSDPMDGEQHGTHVAGTIGAVGNNGVGVTGVAWNVKILPCRFLDANGVGTTAGAIRCLDYIAAMKDRGVDIVASNNSWGSSENSRALGDAIRPNVNAASCSWPRRAMSITTSTCCRSFRARTTCPTSCASPRPTNPLRYFRTGARNRAPGRTRRPDLQHRSRQPI